MKTELHYYDIYPKVVKSGVDTEITVRSLSRHVDFKDGGCYTIYFVPLAETRGIDYSKYDHVEVKAETKTLQFNYNFGGEQPYALLIHGAGGERTVKLMVYSLFEDLHGLTPFLGETHIRSSESDGTEAPEYLAAYYRQAGYDFFCLTDHRTQLPSIELAQMFKDVPIDLKIYPGEEINRPDNCIHTVNFGGEISASEYIFQDEARYLDEVAALQKNLSVPEGVDPLSNAKAHWLCKKIKEGGGLAILAHPHWLEADAYNIPDRLLWHLLESEIYDAFELIGGTGIEANMMHIAVYGDARAKGLRIPVVGGSDAHIVCNAARDGKTLVFARDSSKDEIIHAIKDLKSVALEQYPELNETRPRIYGLTRIVCFANFLVNEYFPLHDALCYEEGRLMFDYINGVKGAKDALARLSGRTGALIDKYWGRKGG